MDDTLYRLTLMSGVWYAAEILDVASDIESIESLAHEGTVVVICDDLEWCASEIGIDKDEIVTT